MTNKEIVQKESNNVEEDVAFDNHLTNVTKNFTESLVEEYVHHNRNGYTIHYKHKNDAESFRADWIGNFFVTFSIPKNKTSVVCSFWGMEEQEDGTQVKRKIQIDLVPTVANMIEYYYNNQYLPMPKHNSNDNGDF